MKFYPADWRSDEALRSCSIAARGLWVEMMALMHVAEPYGSLLVKGKRPDKKRLAALAGISEKECTALLLELEGVAVFARDPDGTIYSRRMRRDSARAEEGRKQVSKRWGNREDDSDPTREPIRSDDGSPFTQRPEARKVDDADDARVRDPLVTPDAMNLAERLLVIAGHDPKFWPPGWCGAPMRVQTWLSQGWQPEIIVAAVTGAAARKRGQPANSVQFFENAIAEEVARQAAPLPEVQIRQAEKLTVTNYGTPQTNRSGGSLTAELRRELAELERSESADLALPASPVLRISG